MTHNNNKGTTTMKKTPALLAVSLLLTGCTPIIFATPGAAAGEIIDQYRACRRAILADPKTQALPGMSAWGQATGGPLFSGAALTIDEKARDCMADHGYPDQAHREAARR